MRYLAVLSLATSLAAQDGTPTFQASSELVLVDVQVVHAKTGTPAPLLGAANFQVLEEGVRQEIRHFSRDEFPLSVVLLFDLTDSARSVLQRLASGAEASLEHLKPADEVAVMAYGARARLLDGFTTDRAQTVAAIEKAAKMKSGEQAYFNEAIYQASEQLRHAANPSNRRVIIWLTDNLPNVPNPEEGQIHSEIEALRLLQEEGVVVAPILLTNPLWAITYKTGIRFEAREAKKFPPGDARKYAAQTGGQAVSLRGKEPEERLAQLIDELRARYTIGYRPSDPQPAGTFRKIEVKLAESGKLRPHEWVVLARKGYYRK